MKLQKMVVLFFVFVIMMVTMPCVIANESISVVLDDKKIEFDVQPTIMNNRTMVPLRFVSESLGAQVAWDDATQTANINDIELPAVGVEKVVEDNLIKAACNGEMLSISATNSIESVNVYNASGALVLNAYPTSSNAIISVANLANGVYFAQITTGGNVKTIKFIK